MPLSRVVEIVNERGLHARASAKFVKLAAGLGSTIEIAAEGPEARPALDALVELVQGRFDEDQ